MSPMFQTLGRCVSGVHRKKSDSLIKQIAAHLPSSSDIYVLIPKRPATCSTCIFFQMGSAASTLLLAMCICVFFFLELVLVFIFIFGVYSLHVKLTENTPCLASKLSYCPLVASDKVKLHLS